MNKFEQQKSRENPAFVLIGSGAWIWTMDLWEAQASPIFHSSGEGKLGIALEWLQGQ